MIDYKTTNRIYRERDLKLQKEQESLDRGLKMLGVAMAYVTLSLVMFAAFLGFFQYYG